MRVFIIYTILLFMNLLIGCGGLAESPSAIHSATPKVSALALVLQRLIYGENTQPDISNPWRRNDFTNRQLINISDVSNSLCAFCKNYVKNRQICTGKLCSTSGLA
ncbi:uncharacterized protein LOC125682158 [Ostrea edulis]|uniref:uncharacterized protein LOC125682158 n=1 Tax=Ostrea edulis TaxID=37623 RepID=UPI00209412CC|nr:uncharacterized protein LOC125682158 [Ostrea edulis]